MFLSFRFFPLIKKKTFIYISLLVIIIVRTRFVTTRNSVGFTRKKAQIISFVERGFERLGLSH